MVFARAAPAASTNSNAPTASRMASHLDLTSGFSSIFAWLN
jgi:hypothetical protein